MSTATSSKAAIQGCAECGTNLSVQRVDVYAEAGVSVKTDARADCLFSAFWRALTNADMVTASICRVPWVSNCAIFPGSILLVMVVLLLLI